MATESSTIVERLWNYGNVLLDDGMYYGDTVEQLASSNTPTEVTLLQRKIETTNHQIDALLYELYGLAEEEISLVKGDRSRG
jgi:hypothetical protein